MTTDAESALTVQLRSDMEAISASVPHVDRWAGELEMLRALEREKERTRILSGYIVNLLDRVERLERNTSPTSPQNL